MEQTQHTYKSKYPEHCFNPRETDCWLIGGVGRVEIERQWEEIRKRKEAKKSLGDRPGS